jgi:hypothetical protein
MANRSDKVKGGRVTPKGTQPVDRGIVSGRYTPPIPREVKVSPMWVPIVMFTCLGIGMLMIVLNYLSLIPTPGAMWDSPNNAYLLLGLGFITAGFITATRYH